MTTVAEFVRDTLGLIAVVDAGSAVDAADMTLAIRNLNRLCTRLEANTLALGWANVSGPNDTLPLPPEAELGVMYQLAVLLAPSYGVSVSAEVAAGAETYMADLRRDQAVATPIQPLLDAPTPDRYNRSIGRTDLRYD